MDLATHFLVPYAAALVALGAWRSDAPSRRVAWALAFGLGGAAPDADTLLGWMARPWPVLYYMQHRGLSHTLLGAPLFALGVMGAWLVLARKWRRLQVLNVAGATLAAALGSLTHLLLDALTFGGVPLLWPFASGRLMWPLFSWVVWWLFPVGAILVGFHVARRLSRRGMVLASLSIVLLLVGLGAYRALERPDAPAGGYVYPRNGASEWTVLTPVQGGWQAQLVRDGTVVNSTHYQERRPPGSEGATQQARETWDYEGYLMGRFGPEVVQAERYDSGWNVTFVAVAQAFDAQQGARWTPADPPQTWGVLRLHIAADGVATTLQQGW